MLSLDKLKGSQKGNILHSMRSDGIVSDVVAFGKEDETKGREIDYLTIPKNSLILKRSFPETFILRRSRPAASSRSRSASRPAWRSDRI